MVVINTTGLDDWSFGGGIATMLAAAAPEIPQ
jgi:hypothetical protein